MEARTEDFIDGLEDGLEAIIDEFGGLESDDDEALDVGAEGDNDRSGSGPSADSSGAIVAIDPNAAHSSSSGGGAAASSSGGQLRLAPGVVLPSLVSAGPQPRPPDLPRRHDLWNPAWRIWGSFRILHRKPTSSAIFCHFQAHCKFHRLSDASGCKNLFGLKANLFIVFKKRV